MKRSIPVLLMALTIHRINQSNFFSSRQNLCMILIFTRIYIVLESTKVISVRKIIYSTFFSLSREKYVMHFRFVLHRIISKVLSRLKSILIYYIKFLIKTFTTNKGGFVLIWLMNLLLMRREYMHHGNGFPSSLQKLIHNVVDVLIHSVIVCSHLFWKIFTISIEKAFNIFLKTRIFLINFYITV